MLDTKLANQLHAASCYRAPSSAKLPTFHCTCPSYCPVNKILGNFSHKITLAVTITKGAKYKVLGENATLTREEH